MKKLRNVLLRYRQMNNLTQQELADFLGVSRNNVANWELDRTTPNIDVFTLIANKLNVDIKLLIDDVDNNKDSMNDTKLALYNQLEQLNEQESQDVMKYIEFIKSKKWFYANKKWKTIRVSKRQ